MLDLISLLPLLDGWEFPTYTWSGTIEKREQRVIERKLRLGWVVGIDVITDDAFGSVNVEYSNRTTGWYYPYGYYLYNLVYPPPAGTYSMLYSQPAPPDTAGLYTFSLWTSAYPLPFKGHAAANAKLDDLSTQSSATLAISIMLFEIMDIDVFKASLKKLYKELGLSREGGR